MMVSHLGFSPHLVQLISVCHVDGAFLKWWWHSPNFIQSYFILLQATLWAPPSKASTTSTLTMNRKSIFGQPHIMLVSEFLRGECNLSETEANAFSGFVWYKVTLILSRVSSLHWGNSVCLNHILLTLKNKRFIGFSFSRGVIALIIMLFSCRL